MILFYHGFLLCTKTLSSLHVRKTPLEGHPGNKDLHLCVKDTLLCPKYAVHLPL